jgi:hypothetical protein
MQFHLARWAAVVVRASTKAAAMAALRTGSAEHGIYKAVGITVLAVFSLGFLVGLAMTLARLSRDNNRTDINYIERYGWVSHHGLISRAALSGAAVCLSVHVGRVPFTRLVCSFTWITRRRCFTMAI